MGIFSKADDEQVTSISLNPIHSIMLDEKDFRCLVRGGVIDFGSLRIALKDIGFEKMMRALAGAIIEHEHYKEHLKENNG